MLIKWFLTSLFWLLQNIELFKFWIFEQCYCKLSLRYCRWCSLCQAGSRQGEPIQFCWRNSFQWSTLWKKCVDVKMAHSLALKMRNKVYYFKSRALHDLASCVLPHRPENECKTQKSWRIRFFCDRSVFLGTSLPCSLFSKQNDSTTVQCLWQNVM